jgi:hypothetical protein
VLCDLRKDIDRCFGAAIEGLTASERALQVVCLQNFLNCIKARCGVKDELAVIEAEFEIARAYEPRPAEKKDENDIYSIED